jgi:predicted ABC-class ATPase
MNNLQIIPSTENFSTVSASGSTSQVVNILEAVESGSSLLLIDEDTCATNFMIRYTRMQALIASNQEPTTPLID